MGIFLACVDLPHGGYSHLACVGKRREKFLLFVQQEGRSIGFGSPTQRAAALASECARSQHLLTSLSAALCMACAWFRVLRQQCSLLSKIHCYRILLWGWDI